MKIKRDVFFSNKGMLKMEFIFTMTKENWKSIPKELKNEILGMLRGCVGEILEVIWKVDKIPEAEEYRSPSDERSVATES